MQVCIITLVANYVIVLGFKLGEGWQLTKDLKTRLDYAAEMFGQSGVRKIVVSGRWSIWFDWLGIHPPITESRAMKSYLINRNVPADSIVVEPFSKDTIGNLFGLRRKFAHDQNVRYSIICAANHEERLRYLCDKIVPEYNIRYIPVQSPDFDSDVVQSEGKIFEEQKVAIDDIVTRKLNNPNYRMYTHPYYKNQKREVGQLLTLHPEILRHPIHAPSIAHDLMKSSAK